MFKQQVAVILAAFSLLGVAGTAGASERCTDAPKANWLSQEAIATKLKQQGFEVLRVKTKRSCYEVKAKDAQGARVELYVDPTSAHIVKREEEGRS